MNIIVLSDTHSRKNSLTALIEKTVIDENIEAIIHCGDFGEDEKKSIEFFEWLANFKVNYRIIIPGNHELFIEKNEINMIKVAKTYDINMLCSESFLLEKYKIYANSSTPYFYNWAYNMTNKELIEIWKDIPEDTDILITHGPAFKTLDKVKNGNKHVGCNNLKKRIEKLPHLKYHFFGHIHEDRGYCFSKNNLLSVNASCVDLKYKSYNKIYVVNLENQEIKEISNNE